MAEAAPIIEISDIIQSLQNKSWTGTLEIASKLDERSSYLFFQRGLIQHCKVDRSQVVLGQALYEQGHIDLADYVMTLVDHEETGRPFGEVLKELGLVDDAAIRDALRFQAREDILDTLTWKDVDARFHAGEEPLPLVFSSSLDTEVHLGISGISILMEAARRADEWSLVSESLPTDQEVLAPINGGILPAEVVDARVGLLVDGFRSAAEIAEAAPMSKLVCLHALADLIRGGQLRLLTPKELAQVGIEAEGDEEYEKALRVYGLAAERGLEHLDLYRRMARCHQLLGHQQEAMERWVSVAEQCVRVDRRDLAIEALQEAVGLDPHDLELRQRLVSLLVENQAQGEAAAQLRDLIALSRQQADSRSFRIELLVQLLQLEPQDMEALAELAHEYLEDGDRVQAMATLSEQASVHLERSEVEEAVEVYARILEIDAENLEARLRLAQSLAELGSTGDAVREYRRLADTLYHSGVIANSINWPFLIKVYESIVELEPSSTPAWEWLARAYLENNDRAKAVSRFLGMANSLQPTDGSPPPEELLQPLRKVVELSPDLLDVRRRLIDAHRRLGQADRVGAELRALAEESMRQGRKDEAQTAYEEAIEATPFDMDARRGLAALLERAGKTQQAQAMWRDVGGICLRAGVHEAAVRDLRRALQLQPQDPDTLLDCAAAEQLRGQGVAAAQLFAQYAKLMLERANFGLAREALGQAARIAPDLPQVAELSARLAGQAG